MPMSDAARAQWQIHLCVLLWGFTAILGKLISLAALPLVWWSMALVTALLAFVPRLWRALRTPTLLSSPACLAFFTSSFRRSSVSGGMPKRIVSPLFIGVIPTSEFKIAFSITLIKPFSHG